MKSVYIGHLSPSNLFNGLACSVAGNQVQKQIISELHNHNDIDLVCYAMCSLPVWPRGNIFTKSFFEDSIRFVGYINLPIVKHLIFSIRMLFFLFCIRPKVCIQYNSFLFENIALLLYRLFERDAFLVILIQDVNYTSAFNIFSRRGLRSIFERVSILLSRNFDLIVPISLSIISDFKLKASKCFVFQGGVTKFAFELMSSKHVPTHDIAVFAGSLEPHNGIDLLVNKWMSTGVKDTLHVFGRGSLSNYIEHIANSSSGRIVYHGFQSEEVVLEWQIMARWNFCLRYSKGLNQKYFFPSKLFNILCAPGSVIVNDFYALPPLVRDYVAIAQNDLSDLTDILKYATAISLPDSIDKRREMVKLNYSWGACVNKVLKIAYLRSGI